MKWLALLFLVVFAGRLRGQPNDTEICKNRTQDDQEKASILKINQTLIVGKYVEAVESIPAPTVEHGDNGGDKFRKDFNQILALWGQGILDSFYDQGVAASQNLIHDVEDKYKRLINSIDQSSKTYSGRNNTETYLKDLVNQLKTLLNLKPGNQTIESEPLPELPKQQTAIVSRTENRSASDFFLHLPTSVNGDSSSVYGFVNNVFLIGWNNTRFYLDTWQLQYRNQFLNDWILPEYRKVVEKVFANRDSIQSCVTNHTWTSFEESGNCIIKISNEWLRTLAELEKYENSS